METRRAFNSNLPARRAPLKRSPIRRKTPEANGAPRPGCALKRSAPIPRRVRINPINRARKARTYARNFGPHAGWVRSQGCQLAEAMKPERRTDCRGKVEAVHAKAQGMGGANGDRRDLLGGCTRHHNELDGRSPIPGVGAGPKSFQSFYQVDVHQIAARNWRLSPFGAAAEEKHAL